MVISDFLRIREADMSQSIRSFSSQRRTPPHIGGACAFSNPRARHAQVVSVFRCLAFATRALRDRNTFFAVLGFSAPRPPYPSPRQVSIAKSEKPVVLRVLQQDSEAYLSSSKPLFMMVEAIQFCVFHPWPSMRFWNTQQKKHTSVFLPLLFLAPQLPFMLRGH